MADQSILLEVILENGQLKVAAKDTANSIELMGKSAKVAGDAGHSGMSKLATGIQGIATVAKGFIALAIVQKIYEIGKAALTSSSAMEKNMVAFEVMLGSQSKATKLMGEIKKFAVETPFEMTGIVDASKQLLAFGISEDNVIEKMRHLGDASMGNQETFSRLSDAYGKVATKGKVSFEELNRFLEAGVPILSTLAEQYGVTTGTMSKMIEDGKIGFSGLDKALTTLTTGSGKFSGLMEKQSKTLGGQFSNLVDTLGQMGTQMGDSMGDGAKDIITSFQQILAEGSIVREYFVTLAGIVGEAFSQIARQIYNLAVMLAQLQVATSRAGSDAEKLAEARLKNAERARNEYRFNRGEMTRTETSGEETRYNELTAQEEIDSYNPLLGGGDKPTEGPGRKPIKLADSSGSGGEKPKTRADYEKDFAKFGESEIDALRNEYGIKLNLLQTYYMANVITQEEYSDKILRIGQELAQKEIEIQNKALNEKVQGVQKWSGMVLSAAQNVMQGLQSIFSIQDQIAEDKLNKQKAIGESVIEWQHQQALVTAGLVEETKIKQYDTEIALLESKLSREKNAKERAKLQEELSQKKSLREKEKIEQEYLRNKETYEAIMEYKRRKMAYEAFKRNQLMSVASIIIQSQVAGMSAFAGMQTNMPGIAGIVAGAIAVAAINTMAGAMVGYTLSQSPPLAAGGYIPGSEYGRTYQIAEKGRGEVVLPVDDPATVAKLQNVMGGSDRPIIINLDGRQIAEVITPHQNQMASARSARNFSYQSAY